MGSGGEFLDGWRGGWGRWRCVRALDFPDDEHGEESAWGYVSPGVENVVGNERRTKPCYGTDDGQYPEGDEDHGCDYAAVGWSDFGWLWYVAENG